MLNENIRQYRKAKGLSQEELAIKLNVVRQTVSKWEKGLSVPDSEMLLALAQALDTSVGELLDETAERVDDEPSLQALAAKLEVLNEQFAGQAKRRRRIWHVIFIVLACIVALNVALGLFTFIQMTVAVDQSVSVIGGSDGPTAILVSRSPMGMALTTLALQAMLLAACVVGIVRTK